jgi:hypothetical protein
MEDVGLFYGHGMYIYCHSVYCVLFWYILLPFGIFHGYLVYFSRFGMLYQHKSGNPDAWSRSWRLAFFKKKNWRLYFYSNIESIDLMARENLCVEIYIKIS